MKQSTEFDRDDVQARLLQGLAHFELPVAAEPLTGQLMAYLAELHKWNRAYNLTAVREPREMLTRHVFDSLTVLPFVSGQRIADMGTGAGLPGLLLALCYPDKHFTLVDSNGKKSRFVSHVVGQLQLPNIDVVQARVESLEISQPFDTIVCRAFMSLHDFAVGCGRLLAASGRLVAMKGRHPTNELAAIPAGWRVEQCVPAAVPGLAGERHIIVLAQDGATD
jgi:16S rRNA (guanine527-N7)-methyltransferase